MKFLDDGIKNSIEKKPRKLAAIQVFDIKKTLRGFFSEVTKDRGKTISQHPVHRIYSISFNGWQKILFAPSMYLSTN